MKIDQENNAAKTTKGGKPNLPLIIAIGAVLVVLIIAGIILAVSIRRGNENPVSSETSSISSVQESSEPQEPVSSEEEIPIVEDEFDPETGVLLEFADQAKQYPDFAGHIYIPNTLLDCDVAHRPADQSNSFYLDHNLDGEYDAYGTPFIDGRATLAAGAQQSTILTMYGHNSVNGDYFETVKSYKDMEFYKENPIIEFNTIHGSGTYKIIGYFTEYVMGDFFNYHDYIDLNEENFNKYLTELDKRNLYNSNIDIEYGDKLIALSTCNDDLHVPLNTPFRDVLVARKVRPGENPEVDVDKIEPNEDVVMPEAWVKKYGKQNPYK